jgi:hypothetical protein
MHQISNRARLLAVGTICAAAGAGAGTIAVAGASSGHAAKSTSSRSASASSAKGRHAHGGLRRLLLRSVHSQLTVHTKAGFATVTVNRGTVDSVSGDTLTMTDSTPKASDQKQTITLPATSRVRNDRKPASLSSLTAGERVIVVQLPKRTVVVAHPAPSASSTGAGAAGSATSSTTRS